MSEITEMYDLDDLHEHILSINGNMAAGIDGVSFILRKISGSCYRIIGPQP